MPHYADGTQAETGDLIRMLQQAPDSNGGIGILVGINKGSDTCNGLVVVLAFKNGTGPWYQAGMSTYPQSWTLKDCVCATRSSVEQLQPAA